MEGPGGESYKELPRLIFGSGCATWRDGAGNLFMERIEVDGGEAGEYEIGIDEAGRGPVLGPMVYSLVVWKKGAPRARCRDSKQLSASARRKLATEVLKDRTIGSVLCVISPLSISINMINRWKDANGRKSKRAAKTRTAKQAQSSNLKGYLVVNTSKRRATDINEAGDASVGMKMGGRMNLNELAIDCVIKMIKHVKNKMPGAMQIKSVYVDTIGPAASLRDLILVNTCDGPSASMEVVVEKKADSTYNIVSAASILAKVTRDAFMEIPECVGYMCKMERAKVRTLGSGYPADPITQKWLRENYHEVLGFSGLVRSSWRPAQDIIQAREASKKREPPALLEKAKRGTIMCHIRPRPPGNHVDKRERLRPGAII